VQDELVPLVHVDASTQQTEPVQCSLLSEQELLLPATQMEGWSTQHIEPVQCSLLSEQELLLPATQVGWFSTQHIEPVQCSMPPEQELLFPATQVAWLSTQHIEPVQCSLLSEQELLLPATQVGWFSTQHTEPVQCSMPPEQELLLPDTQVGEFATQHCEPVHVSMESEQDELVPLVQTVIASCASPMFSDASPDISSGPARQETPPTMRAVREMAKIFFMDSTPSGVDFSELHSSRMKTHPRLRVLTRERVLASPERRSTPDIIGSQESMSWERTAWCRFRRWRRGRVKASSAFESVFVSDRV